LPPAHLVTQSPARIAIIANPTAGASALDTVSAARNRRRVLAAAVKELRASGFMVELHLETDPQRVEERAAEAARSGASTVVAGGGDGTVNAVVNGLIKATETLTPHERPALGVLPLGTGNVFAFNLRIPSDWRAACRVIRDGHSRIIDVGTAVSGARTRHFVLMAGIGYDAQVIEETSLRMKYVLRDFAYVLKTLEHVIRHQGTQMTLHFPDNTMYANIAWLVMVGNAASYAWNIKVTPHAEIDDGLLDICLMPYESNLISLQQAIQVLTGQHIERGIGQYWQVESLRVESSPSVPIQLDGDEWASTPVELSMLPGALRVLTPTVEPQIV
jgi:YegS/Rv2252/BmrU family lipid kinase